MQQIPLSVMVVMISFIFPARRQKKKKEERRKKKEEEEKRRKKRIRGSDALLWLV